MWGLTEGSGSRETGGPLHGFPPVRVAAALAVSLGHLQFRPAGGGRGHAGLEQRHRSRMPPSRDAVFQHYYSQLIYVVKVRPALPRFQALPG